MAEFSEEMEKEMLKLKKTNVVRRLVQVMVPTKFRNQVLKLAHESMRSRRWPD